MKRIVNGGISMNIQHLKYAVEVARTGSITQAAENLFIGQPSLSKAIRELEDSLGITIFYRSSRGAVPTEQGADFLRHARAVLMQIDKMEALYRHADPDGQRFSLSVPRSGYVSAAAMDLIDGLDDAREIDIDLHETGALQAINHVAEGRSELAVIRYTAQHEQCFEDYLQECGLRREIVWQFSALVIFSQRHPLADVHPLRAEALFPYVEVITGEMEIPYARAKEEIRPDTRSDKRIRVNDRLSRLEMLNRVSGAYCWDAPLSKDVLTRYELKQRRCEQNGEKYIDALVYPQGHEFTRLGRRFVNLLYERKNDLALQEYD